MYSINSKYIIREEHNFFLAYNYVEHEYYQLNETAWIIISEAVKYASLDQIVNGVCSITGDDPQKAKEDIVNAILLLVDTGILKDDK